MRVIVKHNVGIVSGLVLKSSEWKMGMSMDCSLFSLIKEKNNGKYVKNVTNLAILYLRDFI